MQPLARERGAPVIAVASGTVVSAGWSGGSGQMVHLRHANGFETQYLHLASMAELAMGRLMTNDGRQAGAARAMGYKVLVPTPG